MRLAATVHVDVKLAVAALRLRELGAEVFLAAASPHTTRDDVRAALAERGIASHAWRGMSEEDRLGGVAKALDWGPTHTCEMGADISVLAARTGMRHRRRHRSDPDRHQPAGRRPAGVPAVQLGPRADKGRPAQPLRSRAHTWLASSAAPSCPCREDGSSSWASARSGKDSLTWRERSAVTW